MRHREEAAQQEAGGDEHDHRERDLGDDEQTAQALANGRGAGAAAGVGEGALRVHARLPQRGHQANEQTGGQREAE